VTPLSAKPGIAANNRPWAFRNALTSDRLVGALIDKWLASQPKPVKRMVVLVDTKDALSKTDGTVLYPNALKARGIEIAETISFQSGDIDFSAQVTRAKGLNPDAFVLAAFYTEGANIVRQLRKQGMVQPIVSNLGILQPKFIQLAGAAGEGIMLGTDFYFDNPDPKVKSWAAEFQKRTGKPPANAAGLMYATLHIMRHCIIQSGSTGAPADLARDRDRVRQCWADLKDYTAPLLGATSIDKNGDAMRNPTVIVVKNGQFVSAQ
jgi:branched-chain amino acid transport system substrate-binding protein